MNALDSAGLVRTQYSSRNTETELRPSWKFQLDKHIELSSKRCSLCFSSWDRVHRESAVASIVEEGWSAAKVSKSHLNRCKLINFWASAPLGHPVVHCFICEFAKMQNCRHFIGGSEMTHFLNWLSYDEFIQISESALKVDSQFWSNTFDSLS